MTHVSFLDCWFIVYISSLVLKGAQIRALRSSFFLSTVRSLLQRLTFTVFASSGASVVYFTRWLQVGLCSPAPPWRTSSTSFSGYWVSTPPNQVTINPRQSLTRCVCATAGTPTEEKWPGISSIEEFKSYNFPKYKPQPLINHAPR